MTGTPIPTILLGQSGTFTAKLTGSIIQGTVHYDLSGTDIWMYFYVPDFGKRHNQSDKVGVTVVDDSDHTVVQYKRNVRRNQEVMMMFDNGIPH